MIPASLSAHRILCVRWSAGSKARRSGRFQSSDTAAINDGNWLKQKRGAACRRRDGGVRSPSFSLPELAVPFLNLKKGTSLNDGYSRTSFKPAEVSALFEFAMDSHHAQKGHRLK